MKVRFELPPPPVIEVGLKLAVSPEDRPVTVRATVPVKPLIGATIVAIVVLPPPNPIQGPSLFTVRLKLGTGTTNVMATVRVRLPLTPWTVSV